MGSNCNFDLKSLFSPSTSLFLFNEAKINNILCWINNVGHFEPGPKIVINVSLWSWRLSI